MFAEYKIVISLAIGMLAGTFTTRLYYINKIQALEIQIFEKSKQIQENIIQINDKSKFNFNQKIQNIRSEKIEIKSEKEYFEKTNQLYKTYEN